MANILWPQFYLQVLFPQQPSVIATNGELPTITDTVGPILTQ